MAERKKLGELLIEGGLIDDDQLRSALAYQKKWGGRIGANLIKLGFLDEADLVGFLSQKMRLPSVSLREVRVPPDVLALVTPDAARKYGVIPLKRSDDKKRLVVAMGDPTNLAAIDDLQFLVNARIDPVIASDSGIMNAIRHYYENESSLQFLPGTRWSTELEYRFQAEETATAVIIDDDDVVTGEPEPDFSALGDAGLDDLLVFTGGTEKTIALEKDKAAGKADARPTPNAARTAAARAPEQPTPDPYSTINPYAQASQQAARPATATASQPAKAGAPSTDQLVMGLVKLLIDKGLITKEELLARLNQK